MTFCCAPNCTNSRKKGFRVFRFPSENREIERRKKWIHNCRRDKWTPTQHSVLCEVHFEESQFELNRSDGRKLLKQTAVPSLFNVPNPPPVIDYQRKSLYKKRETEKPPPIGPLPEVLLPVVIQEQPETCVENDLTSLSQKELIELILSLRKRNEDMLKEINVAQSEIIASKQKYEDDIAILKKCIDQLELDLKKKEEILGKFLNEDQVKSLSYEKMKEWSPECIIKGLKFRYMLGVRGYQFLHASGYPMPSYSTLNRRVDSYKVSTGILKDLLEPLKAKVECMSAADKICSLCIDEMQIKPGPDFDKHKKEIFGDVTLGSDEEPATHLLIALVRGLRSNWKQVIAAEFTSSKLKASELKTFIDNCILHVENAGLRVVSFVSDMGNKNVAFWSEVGVQCKKDGDRINAFESNGHSIFVLPDACHLLKNLKAALLSQNFVLPDDVVQKEKLPTNVVSSRYVKSLWNFEVNANKSLRLLWHLRQEDIAPSNFEKMRVGPAVRFFSTETSSGIKTGISCKLLPEAARTTAWFIQFISDWFTLVSSRIRKKSITRRNKEKKIAFLLNYLYVFEHIKIGDEDRWKPLNTGMVMSTISIFDISHLLLRPNLYEYLLLSRLNQDSLENVFSQIRLRGGMTPTPTQCLTAVKTITLSQFISDVKRSNYSDASDLHLLNHFSTLKAEKSKPAEEDIVPLLSAQNTDQKNLMENRLKTFKVTDPDNLRVLLNYDLCLVYNISGCVTNALLTQNFCTTCREFILRSNLNGGEHFKVLTKNLDKGNLKYSNLEIFSLVLNCSLIYDKYYNFILHNNLCNLIRKICEEIEIVIRKCHCTVDMKKFIVEHFFKIKSYGVCSVINDRKRKKTMYGTSAPKRRKV